MKIGQFLNYKSLMTSLILVFAVGCGGGSSISVKPSSDEFQQTGLQDVKIDILFMIDDSGSMQPGQDALSDNLSHFIAQFNQKGFDYRVAVGKTSAHDVSGGGNLTAKNFFAGSHGHRILSSEGNYNLVNLFKQTINAVGTSGTGYEAPLQSVKNILDARASADNFPRAGAHLAVIYIGDEDDFFSAEPVSHYFNHLENTVVAAQNNNTHGSLSTHAIQVTGTSTCKSNNGYYGGSTSYGVIHNAASAGTKLFQIAGMSEGKELSMCSNFGVSLTDLADDIVQRASVFYLDRNDIIAATVQVFVNDVEVPKSATNGFQYADTPARIIFNGTGIPEQDSNIKVTYTTTGL